MKSGRRDSMSAKNNDPKGRHRSETMSFAKSFSMTGCIYEKSIFVDMDFCSSLFYLPLYLLYVL